MSSIRVISAREELIAVALRVVSNRHYAGIHPEGPYNDASEEYAEEELDRLASVLTEALAKEAA